MPWNLNPKHPVLIGQILAGMFPHRYFTTNLFLMLLFLFLFIRKSKASHSQNNLNGTDPEEESRSEVNGTHRTAVANNVEGGIENANRSFLTHQEWSILKRECVRLRTFDDRFSADFLSPLALAGAGFFYLGSADQVQCAFCRGVIGDWEVNDDPRREHLRLFPSCPFILGKSYSFVIISVNYSLLMTLQACQLVTCLAENHQHQFPLYWKGLDLFPSIQVVDGDSTCLQGLHRSFPMPYPTLVIL